MSDDPSVPEFSLPDWGTEGAPPPPPIADEGMDDPAQIEISVERPMLVVAGPLPDRWKAHTLHGLVFATAKSDKDDRATAVESAIDKALGTLRERASALEANAVTDVKIEVEEKKSRVRVIVWGTAVSFSR
jgi:hypothetical protein